MRLEDYDITTQRHLAAFDRLLDYEANNQKLLRMHKSLAKTRLILGGKRSGKTTWGVVETSWAALGIHPYISYPPPPLKIRVCGVSSTAGIKGILLPMFHEWLPKHAIKRWWSEEGILELVNGTLIDFKSYEQDLDKFEGVERHLVWMDEEPPKEIYTSNFMRTISNGINGKLVITGTPLHGLNWIYDELYDNPKAILPAVEHVTVSIFDNPHLTKEAIETVKNDPAMQDELDAALYGKFIPKSGLIYKGFEDKHIIPPVDKPDKDWLIVTGLDLHDRNPHGVLFAGLNKDGVLTVYDEIYEQCIISELAAKIKSRLGDRFPPAMNIADTSLNTPQSISGISEAQELAMKYGIYITEAHKDVQSGILKVMEYLNPGDGKKPKLYITENCTQLIREFRHYVWDEYARQKDRYNPKEKPRKKDDHLLDALRYICMAQITYRPPGFKYDPKRKGESKVTGYY